MIDFSLGWLSARTGTREEILREFVHALDAPRGTRGRLVGFVDPCVYTVGERDDSVRRFLDACDLVCVDGVGIALAHRFRGRGGLPCTLTGHLLRALLRDVDRPARMLLVGIEPTSVPGAAARMNAESTGPKVIAWLHGHADDTALAAFLVPFGRCAAERDGIDVVVVGAESPRSEAMALRVRAWLPDALVFHAGAGALKPWAGSGRREPAWLSVCGLDRLCRLVLEPHAWYRHLVDGSRFARALLGHLIGNTLGPRPTGRSRR